MVSWVSSPIATWSVLIALLSIHLAANHAAVRAVSMRCLNRQRANIVLSGMLHHGVVLQPADVSKRERIFEQDGVLRWADDQIIGHCSIGVTLKTLLSRMGQSHKRTGAFEMQAIKLSELMGVYDDEPYVLWYDQREAVIVLKQGCSPLDQLRAWAHALVVAQKARLGETQQKPKPDDDGSTSSQHQLMAELRSALQETRKLFATFTDKARGAGWDLEVAALETRAGTRVVITCN